MATVMSAEKKIASADTYQDLLARRDRVRPSVVAEPTLTQGFLWPSPYFRASEDPVQEIIKGVRAWWRIATANILTGAKVLGMEDFINTLDAMQRPVNKRKAERLMKEFDIQGTSAADAVSLMVSWAKGDLFWWHSHPYVTAHEMEGVAPWCPSCTAATEMGMGDKSQDMRIWCDYYDSTICQPLNEEVRMVHGNCPSDGDNYCMFSIFEEEGPKGASCYETIKHFNDRKRTSLEGNPNPDYFEGLTAPRVIESWSEAAKYKDGMQTKALIAMQTLLICGLEHGWEEYLERLMPEHTWGFSEEAKQMKRDYDIKGNDLRDAANLLAIGYGLLGFDNHKLIEYTPTKVEGVADKCFIIDAAHELGVADKLPDISLWCDFYHNHKVRTVNEDFRVSHTHCLGRGDKYCRFCLK